MSKETGIVYRASGELRRDWFRLVRHSKDPAEVAAHLCNPQYWWIADPATVPLTEEQWRQVGLGNGRCF